ncbi:uncharacterized protein LOC144748393 [Ciona intestinalis]
MGQGVSYFTKEEQNEILEQTKLSSRYLQEVQKRYSQYDTSKSKDETSGVTIEQVLLIPEVNQHKLAPIFAEKYGGRSGILYPREFVNFFAAFSSARTPSEKVELLFEILDVRKLGYLQGIEMYRYYHILLSPSLSDSQIENVAKKALNLTGGKIDLDKFKQIVQPWEVAEKMTIVLQLTD